MGLWAAEAAVFAVEFAVVGAVVVVVAVAVALLASIWVLELSALSGASLRPLHRTL